MCQLPKQTSSQSKQEPSQNTSTGHYGWPRSPVFQSSTGETWRAGENDRNRVTRSTSQAAHQLLKEPPTGLFKCDRIGPGSTSEGLEVVEQLPCREEPSKGRPGVDAPLARHHSILCSLFQRRLMNHGARVSRCSTVQSELPGALSQGP